MRLLQEWLTRQAQGRPDAPALHWRGKTVTYGGLESLANQLAWMLIQQGCARGDRVALLLPKGPLAITSMLAVLKADCSYTPLDPANPATRIARVLGALECRCVLAAASTGELLLDALQQLREAALPLPLFGLLDSVVDPGSYRDQFGLDDLASCSAESPEQRNGSQDAAQTD